MYNYSAVPLQSILRENGVRHDSSFSLEAFKKSKDDNAKIEMMGISFVDIMDLCYKFRRIEAGEKRRITQF